MTSKKELEDIDKFLKDALEELFPAETDKSELEKAAKACAKEAVKRDHHGTDEDLILCGFNSGAFWLVETLEKYAENWLDSEFTRGFEHIIQHAKELCGK